MCVRMSMRAHMFPQHRTRSRKLGASARRAPLRKEALGSAAVPAAYSEGLGGLVAVAGSRKVWGRCQWVAVRPRR